MRTPQHAILLLSPSTCELSVLHARNRDTRARTVDREFFKQSRTAAKNLSPVKS
jgi:hypothetical protein